jgi:hypothetical protein
VFVGTSGQIVWDQDTNTVTVYKNTVQNSRAVADPAPRVIEYSYALTPLQVELRHWLDCLRTRQQPRTGIAAAEAVANLADQIKTLI